MPVKHQNWKILLLRHLTTFFQYVVQFWLDSLLFSGFFKCKKRGQDLKTIVQSLYSLELFLSASITIELFVILGPSNRQIVCWFCLTYFPIVPEGKTLPRWVFLQKTAVSALSKRMLPSCKNCALHVQSRSLQVKVIGLFILLAEFRAVMIKLGKYHVVTYFTSVKVWNTFKIAYWYRSQLCTNVFTFYH